MGRNWRRKVGRKIEGGRQERSGECAEDARLGRKIFLQTRAWPALLFRLPFRSVYSGRRSSRHDRSQVVEGSKPCHQKEFRRVVDRSRRWRRLSRVSFKDELDWRR